MRIDVDALRSEPTEALIASYERLRDDVHARDNIGQRLFRQRGLAAWLMEWGSPVRATPEPFDTVAGFDIPLSATSSEELTFAVATVVQQAAGALA